MLDDDKSVVRYEFPLQKIIPKALFAAQQTPFALMPDDQLFAAAMPDSLDWRLRIRYSSLMQKVLDPTVATMDKVILAEDIYQDICSYDVYKRRVDISAKAVFICRKIGSYIEDQDALLTAFSTRLWEIASAPIMKRDGSLDIEASKILHKTIQILLDRKFGQAVQRQVHAHLPVPHEIDPSALEAQIRSLEAIDGK